MDFESAILEELSALRGRDRQLLEEEQSIRQRRSDVAQRVAECETALRVFREKMGRTTTSSTSLPLVGEIAMGKIADMAFAYLQRQGGSATVKELVAFLIERGKFTREGSAAGYYGTVFKTLSGDKRFIKATGTGRFHLATERDGNTRLFMEPSKPIAPTVGVFDTQGLGLTASTKIVEGAAVPDSGE